MTGEEFRANALGMGKRELKSCRLPGMKVMRPLPVRTLSNGMYEHRSGGGEGCHRG